MDTLFGGKAKAATRKRAPAKSAAKTTGRKAKSAKPAKAAAASPKSRAKSAKTAAAGNKKAPSPAKEAAAKKAPVKKATSKKVVSSKAAKRAGKAQAKARVTAPKAVSEGGRRARSSKTVSYTEASESDSGDLLTDQEESEAELDESSDEEGPHGTKSSELKVDKVRLGGGCREIVV